MSGRDLDRCNVDLGGGAQVVELSVEGASALASQSVCSSHSEQTS